MRVKSKNIHVLPTEKPSRLHTWINDKGLRATLYEQPKLDIKSAKNIYITSDEEIKEGVDQWYLDKFLNKPMNSGSAQYGEKQNVIILTTDQDLIKDGVQAIDDEFLEWFVKNPSCEFVEVVYEPINFFNTEKGWEYAIIIPKEDWLLNNPQCKQIESCSKSLSKKCICPKEKPKQETIEEASKRYATDMSGTYYEDLYNAFNNGAKWQQEQDKNKYSEEEVYDILIHHTIELFKKEHITLEDFWNKFKKK